MRHSVLQLSREDYYVLNNIKNIALCVPLEKERAPSCTHVDFSSPLRNSKTSRSTVGYEKSFSNENSVRIIILLHI